MGAAAPQTKRGSPRAAAFFYARGSLQFEANRMTRLVMLAVFLASDRRCADLRVLERRNGLHSVFGRACPHELAAREVDLRERHGDVMLRHAEELMRGDDRERSRIVRRDDDVVQYTDL